MGTKLRYAALVGIAAANAYRAHKLSQFAAGLTAPALAAGEDEWTICTATCTRPHGEVVHCLRMEGHEGFHAGRAEGVPRYTWPHRDSDDDRTCGCDCSLLQADMSQQSPSEWFWRIFDIGCDKQERLFAVGKSEDYEEARVDVLSTMEELTSAGGFHMSEPEHMVTHHIAATVQRPAP
jgi:hypothetical protein